MARLVNEEEAAGRTIAIDGKTLRRSQDANAGLGPLHLVSAWASDHGLALGQVATKEKSNEITAIPALLDRIDVHGAVVTIDAMGCQKEIAQKIVDGGGDYVLAVKDNQPKLYEAIEAVFRDERQNELRKSPHRKHQTRDKGHGRRNERYYVLASGHPTPRAYLHSLVRNGRRIRRRQGGRRPQANASRSHTARNPEGPESP